MDPRLQDNRQMWDEVVPHHVRSDFYDVKGFLRGDSALRSLEVEEVGEVSGLRLLHLQCHFGLDTLSWARRGARVTGIDFSERAIEAARRLAQVAGIEARFETSEVTRTPEALAGAQFERVVTTWGVLDWLPDLAAWARAVHALLAPGGVFYLAEVHPVAWLFEAGDQPDRPFGTRTVDYFEAGRRRTIEAHGTYAAPDLVLDNPVQHIWVHPLGDVVTALLRAGLGLEFLHEHREVPVQIFPELVPAEGRMWRLPEGEPNLPLSFSLRARRPATP